MWVASATDPGDALDTVQELSPDVIVTDLCLGGQPAGGDLVHTLKSSDGTKEIPVVVLSETGAGRTAPDADLYLVKPVLPDTLLATVRQLLSVSRDLRTRSARARARTAALVERSNELLDRARGIVSRATSSARACPDCSRPLDWIESGRIGGVTFDYFRWCDSGCGLYCYDRSGSKWVKLA
jgi:CheY-like chemotaxis protein